MNNNKLNTLVRDYRDNPRESTFREIYRLTAAFWSSTLRRVAQSIQADTHELTEVYEDTLVRCIGKYDGESDFGNFFRSCAKRARIDLQRKKQSQWSREFYEGDGEDDAATFELLLNRASDYDLEHEVLRKKEADQRQLIDFLTDPGKVDAKTTAIVNASYQYRDAKTVGRPKTLESFVADELGIDSRTVKRKLEKLASNFDYTKFGDYTDYLCAQ